MKRSARKTAAAVVGKPAGAQWLASAAAVALHDAKLLEQIFQRKFILAMPLGIPAIGQTRGLGRRR